jgi:hypothetical protein
MRENLDRAIERDGVRRANNANIAAQDKKDKAALARSPRVKRSTTASAKQE